jgi:hypothetical protein
MAVTTLVRIAAITRRIPSSNGHSWMAAAWRSSDSAAASSALCARSPASAASARMLWTACV